MLDITLLGTGGGMPMTNRYLSSAIISFKGRKILLDSGEGTQVAMRKFKTGFKSIDIICITHFHGDHIFGLPGLLSTMGNSGRVEPITIIGPAGLKNIVNGLLLSISYLPYKIDFIESPEGPLGLVISENKLDVRYMTEDNPSTDLVLETLSLDHSSACLGYSFYINRMPKFLVEKALLNQVPKQIWKKLQYGEVTTYDGEIYYPDMVLGEARKGIKLSFITDTRPTKEIIQFIYGSDLFICEGTYGDDEDVDKAFKNKHMTFGEAATLAHEGKVNELLITHFSPAMDEPRVFKQNATKIFKNTAIGYDGLTKSLTFD
ncbi:MAG: ribonuclease Z [Tissierellaceae bacterium]|nr:ribonuclease Z [Tissierellaceae bacterium]